MMPPLVLQILWTLYLFIYTGPVQHHLDRVPVSIEL